MLSCDLADFSRKNGQSSPFRKRGWWCAMLTEAHNIYASQPHHQEEGQKGREGKSSDKNKTTGEDILTLGHSSSQPWDVAPIEVSRPSEAQKVTNDANTLEMERRRNAASERIQALSVGNPRLETCALASYETSLSGRARDSLLAESPSSIGPFPLHRYRQTIFTLLREVTRHWERTGVKKRLSPGNLEILPPGPHL